MDAKHAANRAYQAWQLASSRQWNVKNELYDMRPGDLGYDALLAVTYQLNDAEAFLYARYAELSREVR